MKNFIIRSVLLFVFLHICSCKVDDKLPVNDDSLRDLKVLVSVIENQNLLDKEDFFRKIMKVADEQQRYELYRKELHIRDVEMRKAADKGDLQLATEIQEKYAYLTVLARDMDGEIVDLDSVFDKNKHLVHYSIEKFDSIHLKLMKAIKKTTKE